jgi:hypothetical protein
LTENDSDIRQKINHAIDLTKGLEEPYKSKAFEIIFSSLLNQSVESNNRKRDTIIKIDEPKSNQGNDLETKIENFATKCELSTQLLKNVYDFSKNKPVCIIPRKGTEIDNQIIFSRLLLVAYEEVFNEEWISLRQVLDEHGIGSLGNLAKNLDKRQDLFRSMGQRRGVTYKLIDAAKIETLKLIKELATSKPTQT